MNYDTKEFIESLSIADCKALIDYCKEKVDWHSTHAKPNDAEDLISDYSSLSILANDRLSEICIEVFGKDPKFKTYHPRLLW